ncbi:nuclear transport factor 2 family protein [Embleya sp. MST-111070]|uniref:nuclear transport factor 2 family protein n=1 Tax=Embleya sp. MST-111070 TaxID=3398231 RepID=UPI003F732432
MGVRSEPRDVTALRRSDVQRAESGCGVRRWQGRRGLGRRDRPRAGGGVETPVPLPKSLATGPNPAASVPVLPARLAAGLKDLIQDGVLSLPSGEVRAPDVAEFVRRDLGRFDRTQHMTGNHIFETGDEEVRLRANPLAVHRHGADTRGHWDVGAVYHCVCEHTDDGRRFARRVGGRLGERPGGPLRLKPGSGRDRPCDSVCPISAREWVPTRRAGCGAIPGRGREGLVAEGSRDPPPDAVPAPGQSWSTIRADSLRDR